MMEPTLPQQEPKPAAASEHPEIHDRVLDAYQGKLGDQFRLDTHKRIHWVCSKVKGLRVLDVGCSQGIAPVLLGREGCQVTGIDIDPQAIAAAEAFLASQSPGVQKNITFLNADFITHPFDREIYDTVILSEVLEHLVNPATFVELAAERLEAGGRLVITVPFGINDWIDHKWTYYAIEPLRLVWKLFSVDDVEFLGKWIGFSCSKRPVEIEDELTDWPWSLLERVETAFYAIERSLLAKSITLDKQLDDTNKKNRAVNDQVAKLQNQLHELLEQEKSLVVKENQIKASEEAQVTLRADVVEARANLDEANLEYRAMIAQVALLKERITQADTELAQSRQDVQTEQVQRHAGEVELAKLQEQLKYQQALLAQQRSQFEQIVMEKERQIKTADEELEKIRREVREVRAKLDETDLKNRAVNEQTASLKELMAQYQSKLARSREEVQSEQAQRIDAEKELVKLQEQLIYQRSLTDELLQARERKIASLKEGMERSRRVDETIRAQLNEENATLVPQKHRIASQMQAPIPKRAAEFRVAFIADEFTSNSFKGEFQQIPFEPKTWKEIFEEQKPELFFCESAWSGPDPVRRPWKGQIYASANFKQENRRTLFEILQHCRKQGIPTIFWNKEDPTHYTDRVHDFVKTASEFDFVFTSAAECVDLYKRDYGLSNVLALPFATNPRLFNPIEVARRSSNIVFAGSWYANHQQRSQDMEGVLDALRNTGFNLEIYDRYHGDSDLLHKWPEKYAAFIKPGLPHHLMSQVYKSSRFGLNFNTVTDSSTMFARRVFELMSCNTLVVSNYSRGVEEMFGELVVFADRTPGRLKSLSDAEIDSLRDQALHLVLKEHTYKQRWQQILTSVGLDFIKEDSAVTVVCPVRKREEAQAAISYFERQSLLLPNSRLLLVLTDDIRDIDVATYYQEFNRFGIGVTSLAFARRHALEGRYRPVETPYFAAIEPQSLPNETWLPKAVLHLDYMHDHFIGATTKERYRLAPVAASQPLLGHAAGFSKWLDSGCQAPEKLVYCV